MSEQETIKTGSRNLHYRKEVMSIKFSFTLLRLQMVVKRYIPLFIIFLFLSRTTAYAMTEKEIYEQYANTVVKIITDQGTGTGFFINDMGTVVTCAHVIKGAKQIKVKYNGDVTEEVMPIRYDEKADQTVLQTTLYHTPYVKVKGVFWHPEDRETQEVRNLDKIISMGYPLGVDNLNVNIGLVSAVYKDKDTAYIYQSDITINPGNSGGPIFDSNGYVIGIATSKIDATKNPNISGINFIHSIINLKTNKPFFFKSNYDNFIKSKYGNFLLSPFNKSIKSYNYLDLFVESLFHDVLWNYDPHIDQPCNFHIFRDIEYMKQEWGFFKPNELSYYISPLSTYTRQKLVSFLMRKITKKEVIDDLLDDCLNFTSTGEIRLYQTIRSVIY